MTPINISSREFKVSRIPGQTVFYISIHVEQRVPSHVFRKHFTYVRLLHEVEYTHSVLSGIMLIALDITSCSLDAFNTIGEHHHAGRILPAYFSNVVGVRRSMNN
jgi:hypothetical protein